MINSKLGKLDKIKSSTKLEILYRSYNQVKTLFILKESWISVVFRNFVIGFEVSSRIPQLP